jgi:hypothetical protein
LRGWTLFCMSSTLGRHHPCSNLFLWSPQCRTYCSLHHLSNISQTFICLTSWPSYSAGVWTAGLLADLSSLWRGMHGPPKPIQRQLQRAFAVQTKIGWDQFFCRRIAKAWQIPIGTYYTIRQPGDSFTPAQLMQWTRNYGSFQLPYGSNAIQNYTRMAQFPLNNAERTPLFDSPFSLLGCFALCDVGRESHMIILDVVF